MDLRIRNRGVGDAGGNTRTFVQDVKIMANQTRFESITPMPMSSSAKRAKKQTGNLRKCSTMTLQEMTRTNHFGPG